MDLMMMWCAVRVSRLIDFERKNVNSNDFPIQYLHVQTILNSASFSISCSSCSFLLIVANRNTRRVLYTTQRHTFLLHYIKVTLDLRRVQQDSKELKSFIPEDLPSSNHNSSSKTIRLPSYKLIVASQAV